MSVLLVFLNKKSLFEGLVPIFSMLPMEIHFRGTVLIDILSTKHLSDRTENTDGLKNKN